MKPLINDSRWDILKHNLRYFWNERKLSKHRYPGHLTKRDRKTLELQWAYRPALKPPQERFMLINPTSVRLSNIGSWIVIILASVLLFLLVTFSIFLS